MALFGPKNTVFFGPEINFLWTASKKTVTIMTVHLKDNVFVLTASERFAADCYFERASTNLVDFLDKHIK